MPDDFADWYFRPRSIEARGGGQLYRLLGVRLYKHYLPTSGDLVSRLRGVRRLDPVAGGVAEALERYEMVTRSYEARHILGAVLMLGLSAWAVEIHHRGNWGALLLANLLVNGYPIMVQRYNRARLLGALPRARRRRRGSGAVGCA
jgi:Glycosyl-4,4'-diaponeurosporenoate acyltransferase